MDEAEAVEPSCQTRTSLDDRTATEAITRAVADAEGISPLHVDPPLDDVVDTDLLDRLFAPARDGTGDPSGLVIFPYRGHQVTVYADGFVKIDQEGDRDLA